MKKDSLLVDSMAVSQIVLNYLVETIPIRYATVKDEGFDFEFSKKNRIVKTLIRKNL